MTHLNQTFDYIIVGAGSAGCVMANRLSKDPDCKVLLLEAGPSNKHLYIDMPAAVAKAIESPKFNWHYWTTPQKHLNDRQLTTPRGKVLGGSSSINALVYMRGQAEDYDRWQAEGCKGWDYQSVLPYFKSTETNCRGTDEYRGGEGELYVGDPESDNPMFKAFIDAGQEMGYPFCKDFNGEDQEGFGYFQLNIKEGRRWSSARAFLDDANDRPNLTIATDVHVLHLNFHPREDKQEASISGVSILSKGEIHEIKANKTILCAGAIGTPQLLLCSGIGPAEELKALDIMPKVDLQGVGKNLQDHMEVKVKCRINQPLSLGKYTKFPHKYLAGVQYLFNRSGVCRQQGLEAGAFLSVDKNSTSPDTQLHFINALSFDGGTAEDREHGFAIDVTQLRPESRGTLTLTSKHSTVAPNIDPNYLATDYDRKMLRDGLILLRELCEQPALKQYIDIELFPGEDKTSNKELDELIRSSAESIYHPVGTAKMGTDPMAVVNPETMNVYGTENLFIADGSIMPSLVSGNTHAVCVMIGAKAAEIISKQ